MNHDAGHRRTPGSEAPCLAVPALVNSLPRTLLKGAGRFSSFLRCSLQREAKRSPTPFTWPCPMPFPEAFLPGTPGLWKKMIVNLSVARLSFEHMGCPTTCPSSVRLGVPLNPKQWQLVRNIEHLVFGSFFPLTFEPEDYGRIGHKVEGQAKTLQALGRAAAAVCQGFSGYLPRSFTGEPACGTEGPSPATDVGTLPGRPDVAAIPIVADRVKLPSSPAFDPVPFMDRTTREFYRFPLHHARTPDPLSESPPFVKILADSKQKLLLLRNLARSGRLLPLKSVPASRMEWGAGLFCVAKDGAKDRLVLDARPANELEDFPGHWVHTLASASCLSSITLHPHECLLFCGTDLQDCFYQFKASEQRVTRNHLACKLTPHEAAFVFDTKPDAFEDFGASVLCGLSSLAMGDSSACEFAQYSHLGVLLQAKAVHVGELLMQAQAPPRGLLTVGLVIDDLIILQKCLESEIALYTSSPGSSEASQRLGAALSGYDAAQLRYSEKKTFRDKTQASFWGIDCCGRAGLVRANPCRYWPLVLITVRVLQLGLATRALLESLLGSWVSVFMLRRRLLCLVELTFRAVRGGSPQTILRLSPELKCELASFVCLGHLAVVDLRALPLSTVVATDASSSWQAAVSAEVDPKVVSEFQRFALQRGAWTHLLAPPAAWLKEHNLLEPEAELPGDTVFTAHPVAEMFARVPQYRTRWRREYKARIHINVAELGAYLHEEARIAGRVRSGRPLTGLDSQVCLGALVKGRSASGVLNKMLRASLGPLLGSRLFPAHLFLPSALNPADDPTRNAVVRRPSLEKPDWWSALEQGDVQPFDSFLGSLPESESASRVFKQEELLLLGGSRPVVLRSNRERGLAAGLSRGLVKRPAPPCAPSSCSAHSCKVAESSRWPALFSFPVKQFVCKAGVPLDLSAPGVLDLWSHKGAFARAFVRAGAPWVLTFDPERCAAEDLGDQDLQLKLEQLVRQGAFLVVGGSFRCSSFSRAIRPTIRTGSFPAGLPVLSSSLREKVLADNFAAEWLSRLRQLCVSASVLFWFSHPDSSFLWRQAGWEDTVSPVAPGLFRADFCQFGCLWRKRTRVATNCSLAGARLLCRSGHRHLRLVGHAREHRAPWTAVASTVPAAFADILAASLCAGARWTQRRPLDPAACAKLGCSCRVGEAKNPGPRRPRPPRFGDLEGQPLQSNASLFLGTSAWQSFLAWVGRFLSCDPVSLFVSCPILAAMALRAYGNELYSTGGSKHSFRYTLVGAQREIVTLRGNLGPAWELLSRWEAVEPVVHRTPVPEALLKAMVTVGWLRGFQRWAGCALLAFYGMARIGEVLVCRREQLVLPDDLFMATSAVFLRLDSSKTSLRGRPKIQHIRVDDAAAMELLTVAFSGLPLSEKLFPFSPAAFRTRWDRCLRALALDSSVALTPGGLRGGGAVSAYHRGTPVADIQWKLRLKHMATLEHYLQEVAALSALGKVSEDAKTYIRAALQLYPYLVHSG